MLEEIIQNLCGDPERWAQAGRLSEQVTIPSKTVLLKEGEVSKRMYLIQKGCLRLGYNHDGKDITFQFFFENQGVSSIESYFSGEPSLFSLESIEPTEALAIPRDNWDKLLVLYPHFRETFHTVLLRRMGAYARLFLSRIKDTPQERYEALQREHPEIIQRVPQHYIASYLGITPVSLSRIRKRRVKTAAS